MSLTTPWLPTVTKLLDGQAADSATFNPIIEQLTQREQHLFDKINALNAKSSLVALGLPIHPSETLGSGELCLVYQRNDVTGAGVGKCLTGFTSSALASAFTPKASNYTLGLVKQVYPQTKTVDLYVEGICDLPIDIDDPSNGLLVVQDGAVEPFRVGPYYLSAKTPGKLTSDPSGIPVYAGFAISKRQFLLQPNVDEFSQFFVNYRFHVLDRVAGIATLSGTWSIGSADLAKLGWVPAASTGLPIPAGAVFYYNIPGATALSNDTALTSTERTEAAELLKWLPPVPANFVQLYQNGTLVPYKDDYDTTGLYSINEYGIWWHSNAAGQQPWSSDYPSTSPTNWTTIKAGLAATRKSFFINFAKFNPALRTQLVSSLTPFNQGTNKAKNFIKLYSKDDPTQEATTGDLLLSIEAPFNYVGFNAPAFTYPSNTTATYTANRALANLVYSKADGAFKAAVTPVVAKLEGVAGIGVQERGDAPGVWQISYLSNGTRGQVDSIEPLNTRLQVKGLTYYLQLPPPSSAPYGLVGKIVLPKGYPTNKDLRLVFHLFGDSTISLGSLTRQVAFELQYSSVSAVNGDSPTTHNVIDAVTYTPPTNPIVFDLAPSPQAYVANVSRKIADAAFTIPAEHVGEDSIVNFKILRVAVPGGSTSYPGNVGLIATYWEIPN